MKARKIIALVLSLVMVAAMFAGCGAKEETPAAPSTPSTPSAPSAPSAPSTPAEPAKLDIPAVPDLGGMTSLEWLLTREDKLSLGGIAPDHYESRADVYKGLDQVDPNDDEVVIGWIDISLGAPWFLEVVGSAKARAEEYGYKLLSYDSNFDLTTQTQQVENLMAQGIDFLVVDALDIDSMSIYFKQFAEMGIPVIAKGANPAKAEYNVVTTVISNCWESGFVNGVYAAEQTFGKFDEAAKFGTVTTGLDGFGQSRTCGFICGYIYKFAELAGQPYDSKWDATVVGYNSYIELRDKGSCKVGDVINLVGYVTAGNVATSSAAPASAELLTAHPDLDIVQVETDSHGLAMVMEIQQMGLVPGEDILVCYASDGLNTICEAIEDGIVLSMGSNSPYPCGEDVIDLIHDIMNGFDANNLPANTYVPTYCINTETLPQVWSGPEQTYTKMLGEFEFLNVDEYNAANAK